MKVYVLDGYNVIHAVPEFERCLDKSLEAARKALISQCVRFKGQRGDITKIVIVFDGQEAYQDFPEEDYSGVHIIFSNSKEKADDRILTLLEQSPKVDSFIIVSNDNYVFNNSRALGARGISVAAFFADVEKKLKGPQKKSQSSEGRKISPQQAADITEEYKRQLGIE